MLKGISFRIIYLRTIILGFLGLLGLLLLAGAIYYVNFQASQQVVSEQHALNWVLAGKVIAIDPGHGGYDPGAKGAGGTLEKDLNLAIAHELKDILLQTGAVVVMTRETDKDLLSPGDGTKKFRDLSGRLRIIQEGNAELVISIHLNSSGSRWRGGQVFYHPENPQNKILAASIQEELRTQLQNTNREPMALASAYLLRQLRVPAVIVEAGFITNPEEEKLLNNKEYQTRLAYAIAAGIYKFILQEGQ